MSKIAVIQKAPSMLDRERTIGDAADAIAEASRSRAERVVFSEAFVPGYPAWIWRLRPGTDASIIAKLLYPDPEEWINDGDSVVVAPVGKIVAGPMRRDIGILYANVSVDAVGAAKRRIDVAGHYARPDIFQLHVNRQRQAPVTFD